MKPPSLRLVLSVFFGLGPVLMGPLMAILYTGTGGEVKADIVNLLYGSMMMAGIWWFSIIFGSWLYTVAPTFAAAILFWLVSRILSSQSWLQFDKKISRIAMSCAIGGVVSAISFICITRHLFISALDDPLRSTAIKFAYPFREDLFYLVLVTAIGIGLGAVLGNVEEKRMRQSSPNK